MKKATEIGFSFIDRTLKTSSLVLIVFFPFGLYYFGFFTTLAILSGGVWGILNLILLTSLVKHTLRPEGPDTKRAIIAAFVKFPFLYLTGYFLLKVTEFDAVHLLIGFSVFLVIIVLKLIGRLVTGLDNPQTKGKNNHGHGVSAV